MLFTLSHLGDLMWCIYYRYVGSHHPNGPSAYYGNLVPVLSTLVGRAIKAAVQDIADLGKIELARQK